MSGFAVVLCAPAGTGKTTVARALLEGCDDLIFSISATTRPARPNERPGVDYHFVSRERFDAMIANGELLEWAEVHGERYGTPRANLEQAAQQGKQLVLDIDVQGARQVTEARPETVTVFLLPPSTEVLLERLRSRGSEEGAELRRRLATAQRELKAVGEFEYVVVNDQLEETVNGVKSIIEAERYRRARRGEAIKTLRDEILSNLAKTEL